MDLHAEIVLVALLRGVACRRSRFLSWFFVEEGAFDYGGIHDGPFGESQSFLLEVGVDFLKIRSPKIMSLEKMTELADGGLVGNRVRFRIDTDEAPQWIPCR